MSLWREMEAWAAQVVEVLIDVARGEGGVQARGRAFSMMIYLLKDRNDKRRDWAKRYNSPAYAALDSDCRPLRYPRFNKKMSTLSFDLSSTIATLEAAKNAVLAAAATGGGGGPMSGAAASRGRGDKGGKRGRGGKGGKGGGGDGNTSKWQKKKRDRNGGGGDEQYPSKKKKGGKFEKFGRGRG
jgi:hypothetical protein